MITKKILIEFADPSIRAIDHIQDIRKAAESAGLNLYSRFDVRLQYPMPTSEDKVVVEIDIPEELADNFAIGNHLRGIATYLLTKCKFQYENYLIGKRLLNYIEVKEVEHEIKRLSLEERIDSLILYANLLKRSDEEALGIILNINNILNRTQGGNRYGNEEDV